MLMPNASCTLYLQTGPGAIHAGVCPRLLLAGRRGRREHPHSRRTARAVSGRKTGSGDYVVRGERTGEVTDTQSKRALTRGQASDRGGTVRIMRSAA